MKHNLRAHSAPSVSRPPDYDRGNPEALLATFGRKSWDSKFNVCADFDGDDVTTALDNHSWRRCAKAFITRGPARR